MSEKIYKLESEINEVVIAFEDATIARDVWTHREHLVVALYYLSHHDFETAYKKMKDGLFNLLTHGLGVDLEKEMPYHETMTVFWMRTVADFDAPRNGTSLLDKTNAIVETYDKEYPLRFYSRERLFSDEARAGFIEPDIAAGQS